MRVIGLENNYYLSGNDIWIRANGFASPSEKLEVRVRNTRSQKSLPAFVFYPSPNDDYHFNICLPIRALFPEPEHLSDPLNTIQPFELVFTATLRNKQTETTTLRKDFIRGAVEKQNATHWHLRNSDPLVIASWVEWEGLPLNILPIKIQADRLVKFNPQNKVKLPLKNSCGYKVIKFLNSLGAYQYWVFEHFEIKTKIKAGKTISKIQGNLQQDNFRNIGISTEKTITLHTKTPANLQPIITDLVQSIDVLMYNPNGANDESRWQLLVLEDNECLENSFDFSYENKISFSFSNQTTRQL